MLGRKVYVQTCQGVFQGSNIQSAVQQSRKEATGDFGRKPKFSVEDALPLSHTS